MPTCLPSDPVSQHAESSALGSVPIAERTFTADPPRHVPQTPIVTGGGSRRTCIAIGLTLGAWAVGAVLMAAAEFIGWHAQNYIRPKPPAPLAILTREAGPTLDLDRYLHGRTLYAGTCALCHGPTGAGVQGLGKELRTSPFVAEMHDGGLAAFLAAGRAANDPYNTTKVPMPPRGGNMQLTDADLADLVVFLRGMQDPRRVPESARNAPAAVPPPPAPASEEMKSAALAAAGGDAELAGYIANGDRLFHASCVACHGKAGAGIAGNGKTLVANDFIRGLDDDALLAFVKRGRSPTDPKSTTGIQMPPKGGNPALSDDDLLDIIAYLRTLKNAPVAPSATP